MEQGDPRAEISQPDCEIDDPVILLEDGTASADAGGMTVMPQDLVNRVVGERRYEQRAHGGEERLLGDARRSLSSQP